MATTQSGDRRYQVFVSSTYLDLRAEREAVTAALLEADAFPAGMELFPATDDDAWSLIKRVIEESDYYLLIIGGKYGSIDPETEMSFTEKEYDYARSAGRPVMAFLHGDPESLTVSRAEVDEAKRRKLETFRRKVEGSKHVKYWTTPEGLAGAVALSFNKLTKIYPAIGWVRADQVSSTETIRELAAAQGRIKELESQLDATRTAGPQGTSDLAQGSDVVTLPFVAKAQYWPEDSPQRQVAAYFRIRATWDAILGAIGARLFHEASEATLRATLEEWVANAFISEVEAALIARLDKAGVKRREGTTFYEPFNVEMGTEEFATVLVQFKALGLIENSSKKRSVSDTEVYWTLTPFGETRTLQIRALKRSASGDGTESAIGDDRDSDIDSAEDGKPADA
jgi:hypothetical protein